MAIILSVILVILGIMNVVLGVLSSAQNGKNPKLSRLFFIICISCAIWCLGYALMGVSPSERSGYAMRAVGLLGVFISCPMIIVYLQAVSGIEFSFQKGFQVYLVVAGVVCYFLVILKRTVTFVKTPYGLYYTSNPWIGRYLQYVYLISMFVVWFYVGIKWYRKAEKRREKSLARLAIMSGVVILVGTMFDTVIPLYGLAAFPSSAMTTFFSVYILYIGLTQYNASSTTSTDVSDFIFEMVSSPVLILNDKFYITDCNEKCAEYVGKKSKNMIGTYIADYLADLSETEMERIHSEIINKSPSYYMDGRIKGTSRIFTAVSSVLYDKFGDVICIICVLDDKTKIRDMEEEVSKSYHEAELANATKHAFLNTISADVTSPIRTIIEESKSIQERKTPDYLMSAGMIKQNGESLLRIVEDMMDISQMESGNFTIEKYKYNIADVLKEVVTEVSERLEKTGVKLVVNISANLPTVLIGDKKRVKQIIENLLDNAVKYTNQGYISLILTYRIRYGVVTLRFKVADTGVGIREEDLEVIFGSFNQVDRGIGRSNMGSGLGLTICRNIVKLMGGDISVQSALGKGTVFSFSIDQTTDSEKGLVAYKDYTDKVFIVHEDRKVADSIQQFLGELGIYCLSMVVSEEIDTVLLPDPEEVTLLVASASVLGREGVMLSKKYPGARVLPVYTYENYKKLNSDETGICDSLIFLQISNYLK